MKFLAIVLVVVPMALAITNDEKRNLLDNPFIEKLSYAISLCEVSSIDKYSSSCKVVGTYSIPVKTTRISLVFGDDTLKNTVQDILDVIGSNATKAQCVGVCPMASRQAHVPEFLISFCEPLCGLFQHFVQKFHLVRDPVNVQTKRDFIFPGFAALLGLDHAQVLHIVQQVIDQFGGDATEAQIEGLCHQLIASNTSVLHSGCALLGRSFQQLVQSLHVVPDPGTPGAAITTRKRRDAIRSFAHLFHLDETKLRTLVQTAVDTVSSDQVRQAFEAFCHQSVTNPITDSLCDTAALAFQKLIQNIHIHQVPNPIVG